MRIRIEANGVWGQIAISLRSGAEHPKGGTQAQGNLRSDPENARFRFLTSRSPFGLSLSKPCAESCSSLFAEFRCRSIAAAGDLPFFVSPKKPKEKKGDPGSCVPPLRYGQPAVLGPGGVPLELGFASDNRGP